MVHQTKVAGPIQRATGVRLHIEMGEAGEFTWAKISGGEIVGRSLDPLWNNKPPPVDVIDYRNRIGYQVKVLTDPSHKVSFSGAHKLTKGSRIGGRPTYIGEPEDKLVEIRDYVSRKGLADAFLIVMLLDEDANRAVIYAKRGVHNVTVREMEAIGVIDNDAGVFYVPEWAEGGIERSGLPADFPHYADDLPLFPNIPQFLRSSTEGEVAWHEMQVPGQRILFRHPVHVRGHRRRA